MKTRKKIIVVGGGFAGIQLIKKLNEDLLDVLLIDKINHHQFQPLFYQVAASQIEPSSISFPLRYIFRNRKNIQIRLAEVLTIDAKTNKVVTSIGDFVFDFLVLAIGCKTNFFGNNIIRDHSFTLKSTYDAIKVRNHILNTFEKIISATASEKESLLNLVIVGAGPTGVELAGAFAETKKNILPKDYPGINFSKFTIILIEGSGNTLNTMSNEAKVNSEKYLTRMGVTILTNTMVKNYDGVSLELSNGNSIKTQTVIWAAGVVGNSVTGLPPHCISTGNRIKVNRINQVIDCENIFAIGDIALMQTIKYPKGHPQVANVAISQANLLAKNLEKLMLHQQTKDFEYKDLGSMATIGRNKAVVDFRRIKLKGYPAWLIWMFLHLMLILSVKNKLIIFINWTWAYITKNTSLHLIFSPAKSIEQSNIEK